MFEEIFEDVRDRMKGALESLKHDLAGLRTGRASTALLEPIKAQVYDTEMPLNQLATLSAPEPRLLVVQPWDQGTMEAIEKAILSSDLGLTPSNDGRIIRIPIPPLTEERRRELGKTARKRGEEAKVSVRNVRRDGRDFLEEMKKDNEASEDDVRRGMDEIQKMTDEFTAGIDTIVSAKEKEILEF